VRGEHTAECKGEKGISCQPQAGDRPTDRNKLPRFALAFGSRSRGGLCAIRWAQRPSEERSKGMSVHDTTITKIRQLPESLAQEVSDFVDFL